MNDDDDFAALFEASMQDNDPVRALEPGQTVTGVVVAMDQETVFVDIGVRSEARLPRADVVSDGAEPTVAVGQTIRAFVVRAPKGRPVELRLRGLGGSGGIDRDSVQLALDSGTPIEGEFSTAVKAGLEVDLGGVRAFCPASHVDLGYVADLEIFVGQKHFFRVLEVRDGGRSVIVSRKAILEEARRAEADALVSRIAVGDELDAIVTSLQAYGAFVDLGGVGGLVHVSEISRARVSSPSDALSVGESVRVKVLSVDRRPDGPPKLSLSIKALEQPGTAPEVEDPGVVTATVTKIEGQAVLVDTPLGPGSIGGVELGLPKGGDPRRAFKLGSELPVVLLRREPSGRLRFSARRVAEVEERRAFADFSKGQGKRGGGSTPLGSMAELLSGIELPDRPGASPSSAEASAPTPASRAPQKRKLVR